MTPASVLGAFCAAAMLCLAMDASGQGLAEVARKEAARRENVPAAGKKMGAFHHCCVSGTAFVLHHKIHVFRIGS